MLNWVLTNKCSIHETKKDHKGPKSQKGEKRERNNNNNKEKRRGSQSGQRTCSKDLGQTRGHVARISIRPEDMQQEEPTSRPYICSNPHKGH